jgi:REP element-mobilizing transposase RayT
MDRVWMPNACYFVTVCTKDRRPILATEATSSILLEEWRAVSEHHGGAIGSFCILPDHVHFFCFPAPTGSSLSVLVGRWKERTAKRIKAELRWSGAVWQKGFFDHLLRSDESYAEKWEYVRNNPVRAGLVKDAELWPHSGSVDFD